MGSLTAILAAISAFTGYSIREFFNKNKVSTDSNNPNQQLPDDQVQSIINSNDSSSVTISTKGDNSPAVVGHEVEVHYDTDWSENDSVK